MNKGALDGKQEPNVLEPTRNNSAIQPGIVYFLFGVLELVFLIRLWPFITSSEQLSAHDFISYITSGVAFQVCLVAAARLFWRCTRILSLESESTPDRHVLLAQIAGITMMLLLSAMMFSSFTIAYDKLKP